jgi:hypothetical protein
MLPRDAYRQESEVRVEEIDARLALAHARAKRLAAQGEITVRRELAQAESKIAAARAMLVALGKADEGTWHETKGGVDRAWGEVSTAAQRAIGKLGQGRSRISP